MVSLWVALMTVVIGIIIPIFLYWTIVFLRRIYCTRKYSKAAVRNVADEESICYTTQLLYHFQTEIVKYTLLVIIIFSEVTGLLCYYCHDVLLVYDPIVEGNSSYRTELEECAHKNNSLLLNYQMSTSKIPSLLVLETCVNIADTYVVGLLACLMSYLIRRMKNIETRFGRVKRFLVVLSGISLVTFLFSMFPSFINLVRAIFATVLTRNFIIFVRYVKKFKRALFQAAIERYAQQGSNAREMKQYKYFSYCMNCICLGFFLITTNIYITLALRFIICGLFFGDCYFPFYFFSDYEAILSIPDHVVTEIFRIAGYIEYIPFIVGCIGIFLWLLPLAVITVVVWIKMIHMKIKGKTPVQFRYNMTSITN